MSGVSKMPRISVGISYPRWECALSSPWTELPRAVARLARHQALLAVTSGRLWLSERGGRTPLRANVLLYHAPQLRTTLLS